MFGMAGDFNLEFLKQLDNMEGLTWVGCCNELNAAYAADGYATIRGVSGLITTYGVGELSALCSVAGSYAEHLPVIHITGAPPLGAMDRKSLMHHTLEDGNYDNMMMCGQQFSVAHARITPENAVSEIDRCLSACVLEKLPVYLQFPSNVAYIKIATPATPLRINFASDADILNDFLAAASQRIAASTTIVILVDADVARFEQVKRVSELTTLLDCRIAVMGTAKGVIDETCPLVLGLYAGAFSDPEVRRTVESAECLIEFGVRFIDSTTGSFSERIHPARSIKIYGWHASVDQDDFRGICMGDTLISLLASVKRRTSEHRRPEPLEPAAINTDCLTQEWFWRRIATFFREGDVDCRRERDIPWWRVWLTTAREHLFHQSGPLGCNRVRQRRGVALLRAQ